MKRLIVLAAVSLLLQIGGLYILNNFIFVNSSEFKSKKIEMKKDITKDINATIPNDVDNVDLSYDGKYLTYFKDKTLHIEDVKTGKISEVKTEKNEVIMFYKWLDNRDIFAIVEKVKKDDEEKIQLITYNAINSSKTFVKEICEYGKNLEVDNITASIFTGVYYININKGGSKSTVYRIDRNDYLKKVDIKAEFLANMHIIPHEDRLIYEDNATGKIFVTSPDEKLTFSSKEKLSLLGIDRNDVIYMGQFNGDKISSIVYGKVSENTSDWKTVVLDLDVDTDDLYFNDKSEIIINDNLKGVVRNVTTDSETKYDGKLIKIKDNFIATVNNNGKLIYTNYKNKSDSY